MSHVFTLYNVYLIVNMNVVDLNLQRITAVSPAGTSYAESVTFAVFFAI